MDETYVRVRGKWTYLCLAIDSVGDTVEFYFCEQRDFPAGARRPLPGQYASPPRRRRSATMRSTTTVSVVRGTVMTERSAILARPTAL